MTACRRIRKNKSKNVTAKTFKIMPTKTTTAPKEWHQVRLDDVCILLKGKGLAKNKLDPAGVNKCILYGQLFTTYNEIIDEVISNTNYDEGTKSQVGDILMPGSTTTKAVDLAKASALLIKDVLLGGDINIIRKKDQDYDSIFLAYYLTHFKKTEIESFGQGITIIHLYGRDIKKIKLNLPPLPEQKKIADILTSVDEEIQKTAEIILHTEKLKQGLMRELFTKGIGHKKFKSTKIGEIPVEWGLCNIKGSSIQLIDGDRGNSYPKLKDFSDDGYCLFLSAKNVTKNGFVFEDCSFITKEKDTVLRKGKLQRGDIVLTSRGTVGNVAYYDATVPFDNVRINSGMLIFRHGEQFNPLFLYKYMLSPQMENMYFAASSGSAQPQLPIKSLERIHIPIIPISEQKKIASIISSVDDSIKHNKQQKEKLTQLKKGLMQDLLSGRVRVKV